MCLVLILQCSSHMLLIFSLLECVYDVFIVKIYFLFQKYTCYHIFSQIEKLICIFIRCRSEFKKKNCIFIRCKSEFFKIKNCFFFLNKEKFVSSLDTNLNFFKSKKLIYIFFRYRSDFF